MELGLQNLGQRDWLTLARGLLRQIIVRETTVSGPLVPGNGARIYAFCGPSGVGKTTTVAKLASRMSLSEGLNVVMALTDTYCVGAVEQSRRYAELIGVPMVVADRPEKFLSMLKAYNSADVILVDTPGRVYESDEALNSLADILAMSGEPVETLLHVPAAYSPAHIKAIAKRFAPLNASRVIITKIDESVQAGSILNILNATSLPAAYLTTGSRVPEDIEVAVSERIARYILGSDN
jgi:flagellar biosynthesis protein FlhF